MANVPKIFEGRPRSISQKLHPPVDADGRELEFDVREDEEQNVKLLQCIDLLVAAGYFRARIKGLSPFDKIVGGMTWCITTCNVDIDIDLLFQENSTIGQKIALTERIVKILPKMKCPRRIEPHQIQGLDFIHIYPVMQWLVKRAMETRAEMGDYIRSFSISQFHKNHTLPEEAAREAVKVKAVASVKAIKMAYQPQRRFRHHDPGSIKDEEGRVQTTLLEYGRQYGYGQNKKTDEEVKGDKKRASDSGMTRLKQIDQSDAEIQAEEEMRIKSLMSGMSQMGGQQGKLTASTVGSIVGMQSQEIQKIASHYAEKQSEIDEVLQNERVGGEQQHKRVTGALQKQIHHSTQQLQQLSSEHETLKRNYQQIHATLQKVKSEGERVGEEMAEVNAVENEENTGTLQTLRGLVAMNESLKKQEQEFKAHCKEEMARLKELIHGLDDAESGMSDEDRERASAIDRQYEADREKLQKIRSLLARKNREISSLQRKIDDVPTRAELTQYQRRFVELYNQISTKHTETKQFYTLYNTLYDKKLYLNKEVNLLNSVHDNFVQGMSSPSSKEQYLKQFESIVDGVVQNKSKSEKTKQSEKVKRDALNDEYLHLVDQQRLYFKTVKDFKQECHKNEILQSKIRES